jgi:hypothetical protein
VFEEMRGAARRYGDVEQEAVGAAQLSNCELCRGRIGAAIQLAAAAVQSFERLGSRHWLLESLVMEGRAHAAAGDATASDRAFQQAMDVALQIGAPLGSWKAGLAWGHATLEQASRLQQARSLAQQAYAAVSATEHRTPAVLARLLLDLVQLHEAAVHERRAGWKQFWQDLSQLDTETGYRQSLERAVLAAAQLALEQREPVHALRLLRRYRSTATAEHRMHELHAILLETSLAAAGAEASRAARLRLQLHERAEALLQEIPQQAQPVTRQAPLVQRALADQGIPSFPKLLGSKTS